MNSGPIELEYCWLALPPEAGVVLDVIAGAARLGPLVVQSSATVEIEDTILDNGVGDLRWSKLTLRLRIEDGDTALLTVKGRSTKTVDGATIRAELELPYSTGALRRAFAFLEELGGPLQPEPAAFDDSPGAPLPALARLGFEPTQQRRNRRRRSLLARADADGGPTGPALAELALDTVTFIAGGREVHHSEIELELVGRGTPNDVAGAIDAIRTLGGTELAPWPHSKTALARVLALAGARGDLHRWTDADGYLTAAAYPEIDAELTGA